MIDQVIDIPIRAIWSGQPVRVNLVWHDMDGAAETPTAVDYRVFDKITSAPIAAASNVPAPASTMSFDVPASSLPQGTAAQRRLLIVVEATFANGQKMPAVGEVIVYKRPTLA
jgi:hypothetical protein